MSQLEKQIAEKIRAIANGRAGDRFPVMSGKVVAGSVDENEGTCKVVLSVNDTDCPTEDILIVRWYRMQTVLFSTLAMKAMFGWLKWMGQVNTV